jgi:hypothetical protein
LVRCRFGEARFRIIYGRLPPPSDRVPFRFYFPTRGVFCRASHASFSLEADVAAAQLGHIVLIWAANLAAYRSKEKAQLRGMRSCTERISSSYRF